MQNRFIFLKGLHILVVCDPHSEISQFGYSVTNLELTVCSGAANIHQFNKSLKNAIDNNDWVLLIFFVLNWTHQMQCFWIFYRIIYRYDVFDGMQDARYIVARSMSPWQAGKRLNNRVSPQNLRVLKKVLWMKYTVNVVMTSTTLNESALLEPDCIGIHGCYNCYWAEQ